MDLNNIFQRTELGITNTYLLIQHTVIVQKADCKIPYNKPIASTKLGCEDTHMTTTVVHISDQSCIRWVNLALVWSNYGKLSQLQKYLGIKSFQHFRTLQRKDNQTISGEAGCWWHFCKTDLFLSSESWDDQSRTCLANNDVACLMLLHQFRNSRTRAPILWPEFLRGESKSKIRISARVPWP